MYRKSSLRFNGPSPAVNADSPGYGDCSSDDVVRPALMGKAVDAMTIRFAEVGPPEGWKQQGMFAPTRWLLELYPIDGEPVIDKPGKGAFYATDLDAILKHRGIKQLIVCGVGSCLLGIAF